jgi:hypothetical protein
MCIYRLTGNYCFMQLLFIIRFITSQACLPNCKLCQWNCIALSDLVRKGLLGSSLSRPQVNNNKWYAELALGWRVSYMIKPHLTQYFTGVQVWAPRFQNNSLSNSIVFKQTTWSHHRQLTKKWHWDSSRSGIVCPGMNFLTIENNILPLSWFAKFKNRSIH